MFKRSLELLERYADYCARNGVTFDTHLHAEACERLRQLNYLLGRIKEVEAEHDSKQRAERVALTKHVFGKVEDQEFRGFGSDAMVIPPEIS